MLQEAARNTAGWSIRNLGTVGGNIFAPPPAGDVAVALLALSASVKLVSANGERVMPLEEFYTGFMTTDLQPDELLAEVQVPVPAGKTVYLKYGRKQSNTPAVVTVAAHIVLEWRRGRDGATGPERGRSPPLPGQGGRGRPGWLIARCGRDRGFGGGRCRGMRALQRLDSQ